MSFATARIDAREMGEADRPTVACSRNPEVREGAIFRRLVGAQIGGAESRQHCADLQAGFYRLAWYWRFV
jgi:hypothetical protein